MNRYRTQQQAWDAVMAEAKRHEEYMQISNELFPDRAPFQDWSRLTQEERNQCYKVMANKSK